MFSTLRAGARPMQRIAGLWRQFQQANMPTHAVRNLVFIVAALLMSGVLPAAAGEPNTVNSSNGERSTRLQGPALAPNFKPRYPFTVDEFWGKILRVAAMPDGHVTREQVERIFGAKLKLIEKATEESHFNIYGVHREMGWYFDMGLSEMSARESRFYFEWGFPPGIVSGGFAPPPAGMCIDERKVDSGLAASGWKLVGKSRDLDIPDSNQYRKGKAGAIEVGFIRPEECLLYIVISAKNNLTH